MSEEIKTKYMVFRYACMLEMLKQCIENDGNQIPIELSDYVAMNILTDLSIDYVEHGVVSIPDINRAKHELTRYITDTTTSILNIITNCYYKSDYTSDRYYIDYMKHINAIQEEIKELGLNAFSTCAECSNKIQVEYLTIANSLIQINLILIRNVINNMAWTRTHNKADTCIINLHKSDLMDGEFVTIKSGLEIHGSVFYIRINPDTYIDDFRMEYIDALDGKSQFSIAKKCNFSDSAREMIHFDHYSMHVLSKDSIPKYNIILLY